MKSYFTSEFFADNRARLKELCNGTAPIVITANGLLQRGGDSAYSFAQDANFWYLTGLDEPGLILVMDGAAEYLILPEQSDYQKIFDSSATARDLASRSGVGKIYDHRAGWRHLGSRLKKASRKQIMTIAPLPAYLPLYGMYTNPARTVLVEKMKSYQSNLQLNDVAPHLVKLRMIKQPEELTAIQAAVDITTKSLAEAFSAEAKYKHEYELEAAIAAGFRRRGAAGHAFAPIVAAGQRACTLHNIANDAPIGKGQLVVADVGAEVEHYAADITRTVSFGRPSARQRAVHKAVAEAQEFAIDLLKPGLRFKDYRDQTNKFIGQKLRQLGLIKSISRHNIREYYPHSISHFMGLNVHDAGDYDEPLQPGMVLTVEPGIYIPEEKIGVRIEDDVLMTKNGCRILSGDLPRGLS